MPAGLPSHDTNSVRRRCRRPPRVCRARSGWCWIADQVTPSSVDVIMRMLPVTPTFRYSWHTAYIVPPPSIATAGSPTNMPVLFGIETFLLQVRPPSVDERERAHAVERVVHPAGEHQAVGAGGHGDLALVAGAGVVVDADVLAPHRRAQRRRPVGARVHDDRAAIHTRVDARAAGAAGGRAAGARWRTAGAAGHRTAGAAGGRAARAGVPACRRGAFATGPATRFTAGAGIDLAGLTQASTEVTGRAA